MRSIPLFSWLYDVEIDDSGIHFVLFKVMRVHTTRYEDIKEVREIRAWSIGAWSAYNFKSRLFGRVFLIELRHGWFTKKILITPKFVENFVGYLEKHNTRVCALPHEQ